jgi:hypothetical protein
LMSCSKRLLSSGSRSQVKHQSKKQLRRDTDAKRSPALPGFSIELYYHSMRI